jgi:hypothetical protein
MAVICRAYGSHDEAQRAVGSLMSAGVPGEGIRVLMGEPERDAREAPEGEFARSVGPDDVVGSFAGEGHRRDEGMGTFAGSAAEQRGGSFADIDRETVASYPNGIERVRVAEHRQIHRMLTEAGLDETTADRDVAALHEGRILVLADVGDRDPGELGATLDA